MEKCYSKVLFFRIFRFVVGWGGEVFFYMDFIVLDQMFDSAVSWSDCTTCSPATREGDKSQIALERCGMASWWSVFLFFYYPHTQMERQSLEQLFCKEDTLRG